MSFEFDKKIFSVLPLLAVLAACGGGGGGGSDAGPTSATQSTTTADTDGTSGGTVMPAVSAKYVTGAASRYQFTGVTLQSSGAVTAFEQLTSGDVVTVNANTLTGAARAVADVAGDASFALGRWSKGTAATSSGSSQLESTTNGAYHYVVYNVVSAFPTSGSYTCDAGRFTSPSLVSGSSTAYFGTATGTAALSFGATGAVVDVSITATAGGQQGTVASGARTVGAPSSSSITGNYFAGGTGTSLSIADGSGAKSNELRVIVPFQVGVAGSSYRGIGVFSCTPS